MLFDRCYVLTYHETVEPLIDISTDALPEPDDAAKQQSAQLLEVIHSACQSAGGSMPFSQYMNMALYQPGLGYYSGGMQKFGEGGDFITSPEVSSLFGQCLASQISEVLSKQRSMNDDDSYVIEFGAGSGVLAADILLALEKLDALPKNYLILELSAELKQRQQATIRTHAAHLLGHVQWLEQLPENLGNAVVVANEVLDAMPVDCFRIAADVDAADNAVKVESLMIASDGNDLVARYEPTDDVLSEKILGISRRSKIMFAQGYRSEINLTMKAWLAALCNTADNLVVLLIDYGYNEQEYYHPDRRTGTLMCYYRHRAHDSYLWWPGLQDITAFVNFTDVAYCAVDAAGLEVSGYTTQAAFLLANGLSELHASQVSEDVRQQIKLSQQIKTLTLPSEMGDRFKVMALTKNYHEALQGFSLMDLRNRL